MTAPSGEGRRRISVELPEHLVDWIDSLRAEWGLRGRGDCLTRLLEEVLSEGELEDRVEDSTATVGVAGDPPDPDSTASRASPVQLNREGPYQEDRALVLIGGSGLQRLESADAGQRSDNRSDDSAGDRDSKSGIDLPGFVRRNSQKLRESLRREAAASDEADDAMVLPTIDSDHLSRCAEFAQHHWISLYGQAPGATVLEAAMLWLARDIWPQAEGTDGRLFTWSELRRQLQNRCPGWLMAQPSFAQVMVVAGVLEDPFATADLFNRIPTLTRRFVNRFKRSRRITSFETLESTMTVHGALQLLGLPTQAGASLTLRAIRESYKHQAMQSHPDAGGSTDGMRRLNEAYQMLRELYRDR